MEEVLTDVLAREGVGDGLRRLNPDAYDAQIVGLATGANFCLSLSIEYNPVQVDTSTDNWIDQRMAETNNKLQQAAEKALLLNKAAHEKKLAKKANKPDNTNKPKSYDRSDTPAGLCEHLRHELKDKLESVIQPSITQKDLGNMKRLLGEMSADKIRQVITWLCTKNNWAEIKHKCKITTGIPTVSILYGFRATIVPMALGANIVRRSGGADVIAMPETTIKTEFDEKNGSF